MYSHFNQAENGAAGFVKKIAKSFSGA